MFDWCLLLIPLIVRVIFNVFLLAESGCTRLIRKIKLRTSSHRVTYARRREREKRRGD
jgi:hypothetical protein